MILPEVATPDGIATEGKIVCVASLTLSCSQSYHNHNAIQLLNCLYNHVVDMCVCVGGGGGGGYS